MREGEWDFFVYTPTERVFQIKTYFMATKIKTAP